MAENRLNRELNTREQTARKKSWTAPELLPAPTPVPGYVYRWIRLSMLGTSDPMNVSSKLREGWEPVRASDHPEIQLAVIESDRHKDNIVIGGLMLCRIPAEFADQRSAYYRDKTEALVNSVDNNFMRENDPRMPLFAEKKSKVTFGNGT